MDRWILSELQLLIQEVDGAMEKYELNKATRAFGPFIDNLSNWYIRRGRKRFWKSEDDSDKEQAYQTLYTVLVTLSKLMAPFTPFLSEEIYKNLTGESSVHLADYPVADEKAIDTDVNQRMILTRTIINTALELRARFAIKVRQPLEKLTIHNNRKLSEDYLDIIKEEVNLKDIEYIFEEDEATDYLMRVDLDRVVTPELKLEGEMREVVRAIQEGRKKAKFNVEDRIALGYVGKDEVFAKFESEIAKEVLATKVEKGNVLDAEYSETITLDGAELSFTLKRV